MRSWKKGRVIFRLFSHKGLKFTRPFFVIGQRRLQEAHMHMRQALAGGLLLFGILSTASMRAQDPSDEIRTGTMRPVVRGRTNAAASMKPEATRAAERI